MLHSDFEAVLINNVGCGKHHETTTELKRDQYPVRFGLWGIWLFCVPGCDTYVYQFSCMSVKCAGGGAALWRAWPSHLAKPIDEIHIICSRQAGNKRVNDHYGYTYDHSGFKAFLTRFDLDMTNVLGAAPQSVKHVISSGHQFIHAVRAGPRFR